MAKKKGKVRVSKCYLTAGGNIFLDKDLKKYELPQSKQIEEETKFAIDVIEPPYSLSKLMEWLHLSVVHASCISTKVQDSVGVGWKLTEVPGKESKEEEYTRIDDFFSKVNENEDIISVCKKVMLDYESCGNGYFEVVRNSNAEGGIKAIYHVNGTTVRLCKDKDRWVQQVGQKKVYFKRWGDERILNNKTGNFVQSLSNPNNFANEIIQIKQYTHKSAYYGLPDWLPVLYQMYGEMKEKEYNLDFFTNFGVPAYAVVVEGADLDEEVKEEIQKYFETELKENPHRTIFISLPGGTTVKFEKLSVETKEASFMIYRRNNRDDLLTAHHVPPYRASIVEKGQLGGTVAEDVDRIYLDSVINPRQRDFCWVLNELIIWEGFGIDSLEFQFEDIDIRDKKADAEIDEKYFKMAARTPNEILVAQGKEPYEGGDVYYAPAHLVPVGVAKDKLGEGKEEAIASPGKDDEDTDISEGDYS